MCRIIKIILCIVFITMLLLGLLFINTEHEYDLVELEKIETEEEYKNIVYETKKQIVDKDILGIITIKKIDLKAPVIEGSTQKILQEYIGHMPETASYDGNIGLAGHNRLNKYSYFARLNELNLNDEIIYETKFFTRKYKIIKKTVIYDTDWSYFKNTKDNRITMITCIKDKPNQRLCVQAIEIKEEK